LEMLVIDKYSETAAELEIGLLSSVKKRSRLPSIDGQAKKLSSRS